MNIQLVNFEPTQEAIDAGRYSLVPELMASVGARYSRNNEGLESILSKVDKKNPSKSIDTIFRHMDYGHQSIADISSFAMFIDGISIFAAYYIWSISPKFSGQESSTRYIKLNADGLVSPELLGIKDVESWRKLMNQSFEDYNNAYEYWDNLAKENPKLVRFPDGINDKAKERIQRNYAFDRARYYLPVASLTNMMMVGTARDWVTLCQNLLSHYLPELNKIGQLLVEELKLVVPRLIKHAKYNESFANQLIQDRNELFNCKLTFNEEYYYELDIHNHKDKEEKYVVNALKYRTNRYSLFGNYVQRINCSFLWSKVPFADIRDLNRHRTGTKYCPLVPNGFYAAEDQYINVPVRPSKNKSQSLIKDLFKNNDNNYIYYTLLGHEYRYEHNTTADKMLYQMELRSGTGAGFHYARLSKDMLKSWYEYYPETKELIFEGSSEPE